MLREALGLAAGPQSGSCSPPAPGGSLRLLPGVLLVKDSSGEPERGVGIGSWSLGGHGEGPPGGVAGAGSSCCRYLLARLRLETSKVAPARLCLSHAALSPP